MVRTLFNTIPTKFGRFLINYIWVKLCRLPRNNKQDKNSFIIVQALTMDCKPDSFLCALHNIG